MQQVTYIYQSGNTVVRRTTNPTYTTKEQAIKAAIIRGLYTLELLHPDGTKQDFTEHLQNRLNGKKD